MKLLNKSEKGLKFLISKKYIATAGILLLLVIIVGCAPEPGKATQAVTQQPTVIEEGPGQQAAAPEPVTITLTKEKTMEPSEITVNSGTTLIWQNEDIYPHNLMIYKKTITDLKEEDIIRSQNFYENESFEYTFVEKGEYVVKDVYSGTMKGEITADVVKTAGTELGTIIVE
jgi:plastocyanin